MGNIACITMTKQDRATRIGQRQIPTRNLNPIAGGEGHLLKIESDIGRGRLDFAIRHIDQPALPHIEQSPGNRVYQRDQHYNSQGDSPDIETGNLHDRRSGSHIALGTGSYSSTIIDPWLLVVPTRQFSIL